MTPPPEPPEKPSTWKNKRWVQGECGESFPYSSNGALQQPMDTLLHVFWLQWGALLTLLPFLCWPDTRFCWKICFFSENDWPLFPSSLFRTMAQSNRIQLTLLNSPETLLLRFITHFILPSYPLNSDPKLKNSYVRWKKYNPCICLRYKMKDPISLTELVLWLNLLCKGLFQWISKIRWN